MILSRLSRVVLAALPALTNAGWVDERDREHVDLTFNATLQRSNLGGIGGRCAAPGSCEEIQSASTPPEILIRDVGQLISRSGGVRSRTSVHLRISNLTEYRAWVRAAA